MAIHRSTFDELCKQQIITHDSGSTSLQMYFSARLTFGSHRPKNKLYLLGHNNLVQREFLPYVNSKNPMNLRVVCLVIQRYVSQVI